MDQGAEQKLKKCPPASTGTKTSFLSWEFPNLVVLTLVLGGYFGPGKKYLAPPPPQFPNSLQTPSRPLGPSRPGDPPLLGFSIKNRPPPPPLPAPQTPPSASPSRKNISETSTKGCLQFLRRIALLRSFADLRFHSFADICALLRSFACFCVRPRLERPRLGTADSGLKCSSVVFKDLGP